MKYKIESYDILKPQTISLRFAGGAWARMTFTEGPPETWHVQINSDWGNWSHWWSKSGMSTDIFKFINTNRSYFYEKFTAQEPDLPDVEKTKTNLRKAVREYFNDSYWNNKEEWTEAMRIINEIEFDTFDGFMAQELPEFLQEEPWHYYSVRCNPRSKFFFKNIFPKFAKHIRKLGKEYDKLIKTKTQQGDKNDRRK